MLTHTDVWKAVDKLAMAYGLSTSGLARKAGLDPTTFNKSKRITRDGKLRWPSTESISKIFNTTGAELTEFVAYVENRDISPPHNLPLIGLPQACAPEAFDSDGYPNAGWDEIAFPGFTDPHAFAVEIFGSSMEPVFRDGDILVASPKCGLRRGDRVVVKTVANEVMVRVLKRKTAKRIELGAFNLADQDQTVLRTDVQWLARIIWATQ